MAPHTQSTFWGLSFPVSHPKNSYSTRSRCSSVTAVSPSSPNNASAPSSPACASAISLTTVSKKPPSSVEAAVEGAGSHPPQPHREVRVPWGWGGSHSPASLALLHG